MAPLPIGTIIQTPTIPCTQRAHKSRPYLLQGQENMTSGAKLTLINANQRPQPTPIAQSVGNQQDQSWPQLRACRLRLTSDLQCIAAGCTVVCAESRINPALSSGTYVSDSPATASKRHSARKLTCIGWASHLPSFPHPGTGWRDSKPFLPNQTRHFLRHGESPPRDSIELAVPPRVFPKLPKTSSKNGMGRFPSRYGKTANRRKSPFTAKGLKFYSYPWEICCGWHRIPPSPPSSVQLGQLFRLARLPCSSAALGISAPMVRPVCLDIVGLRWLS
jgi:hypothetical protein